MDAGKAGVTMHGNASHTVQFVSLGGTVTETITGVKTFSSVAKFADGTNVAPGIAFSAEATTGLYRIGAGDIGIAAAAGVSLTNAAAGSYARLALGTLGGSLALGINGTLDAYLYREAAAYLLQRNGVTAQRFAVARTYTDASNYEIGEVGWSGTTFRVGTSHAGTGSARTLALLAGGVERWTVDSADGALTAATGVEEIRWGTTASYPKLMPNSGALFLKLGDESAYTDLWAQSIVLSAGLGTSGMSYIGGPGGSAAMFTVGGTFALRGMEVSTEVVALLNSNAYGVYIAPTLTEQSAGTHSIFAGTYFATPTINVDAASVTSSVVAYFGAGPTNGVNNYSIWSVGACRFDGNTLLGGGLESASAALHVATVSGTVPALNAGTIGLFQRNSAGSSVCEVAIVGGNVTGESSLIFGDSDDVDTGRIRYTHTADVMRFYAGATLTANLAAGILFITSDSVATNANMTRGITIRQGAADNEVLAFGSSDVDHGMTGVCETDIFGYVEKISATAGGAMYAGVGETTLGGLLRGLGGTGVTTPATTAAAYVMVEGKKYSGTAITNSAANELVFGVRTQLAGADRTLLLVDSEGDLFLDGAAGAAFDAWDDVALVRAFDLARSPDQIIRSRWDEHVRYHRGDLVAAGLLTTHGPDAMVNVSQHLRLLNGAVWQQHTQGRELHEEHAALRERLDVVEQQLRALQSQN